MGQNAGGMGYGDPYGQSYAGFGYGSYPGGNTDAGGSVRYGSFQGQPQYYGGGDRYGYTGGFGPQLPGGPPPSSYPGGMGSGGGYGGGYPPPWMMAGYYGNYGGYGGQQQGQGQQQPPAPPQTDYLAQFMQNAPWTQGMTADQVKQALYTITPTDYGNYSSGQEDAINHILGFTPSASTYVPGVGYLQGGYSAPNSTPSPGGNPIARPPATPPTTPPPGGNPIGRPGGSTNGLTPDQIGYGMRVQNGQLVFGGSSPSQISPVTANYLGYKNNGQGQWVNSQGQVVGLV